MLQDLYSILHHVPTTKSQISYHHILGPLQPPYKTFKEMEGT